jgi:DNA integrity scanning protein DisA with diadenylate cyclase activity
MTEPILPPAPAAARITNALLNYLSEIVHESQASALFVYVDALGGEHLDLPPDIAERVFYVAKTIDEDREQEEAHVRHLRVPNVSLTRMGQVKMAVFLAFARGLVKKGDVIVCLSGVAGSGTLDTIVVVEVGREFEVFSTPADEGGEPLPVRPEVLERVVEIATQLGGEGREGRPTGALFVLGDTERVLSLTRQMILNPFNGYPAERRNILDPHLAETVKEFATVDGAFVIRKDGVIESAGTFLKTATLDEDELPHGLGSRHHAAAGITDVSSAVAVVVSQSTGNVTIFRSGKVVTTIERPRTQTR